MVWSRNRLHCLFLALFIWESTNGLGVFQNRPYNYWQSGGGSKGPGDQALYPAVYDVGSAQPQSTSGSGGSAANFLGFLKQNTISSDQNVLNQYGPPPQSQGGYTLQSSVSSGNQPAPGFQSRLVRTPVFPSQGSASQSLASQQSSLQLVSPGPVVSSPPLSFVASYAPGPQTLSSSPVIPSQGLTSDSTSNLQQSSFGSQSAASVLYGQPSGWYSPSQGQGAQTSIRSQTSPYTPVTPSQASASQPPASQQGSSQLPSPSLSLITSYAPGTQTQPFSPAASSLSSTSVTTSQQASSGYNLATGSLYGQASLTPGQSVQLPSQSADAPNKPTVIGVYIAGHAQWYRIDPFGRTSQTNKPLSPSQALGSQGSQAASSSSPTTSQTQSTTGSFGFGIQSQSAPASTVALTQSTPSQVVPVATTQQYSRDALQSIGFSDTLPSQVPIPLQTFGNYGPAFQSSTTQLGSFGQSQGGYSGPGSGTSNYGVSMRPHLSPSSTSQAAPGFQSQLVSSPTPSVQGSASQSLASQQSSLQLASSSQGTSSQPLSFTVSYVPGSQAQPSSSATSLSSASATTAQQASSGSQSSTGTLYGQPSSLYFLSQGQGAQTSPYMPLSPSQAAAILTVASQQGSSQLASPSLSLTTSYAPGTQTQPLSPAPSSLSSTSVFTTAPQQASSGSQSATRALYGWGSSLASSTQGQSVQLPSQSADAPSKPTVGVYTAGHAQWYRLDPFGRTSQTSKPLSPSQASGSQGSQPASSSSPTLSQTQSTPGSTGFGVQSQTAPASTVSMTQSAAQLPSFQTSSGISGTSFSASSPSASVSQPSQSIQSPVTTGASTSFGQSTPNQVVPVATTQQYSRDALQVTGVSSNLPSQVPSASQTSGNYGSAFPSSITQVGSFDQYSPVSGTLSRTFPSAQGTLTNFGLVQDYSTQSSLAAGQPQTAVGSSRNQAASEAQGSPSVYGDALRFSSFDRSGSTSYSFARDLNNPVFKPATRRGQDSSVKH